MQSVNLADNRMIRQPTPDVSSQDVERIVRRDFRLEQQQQVRALIDAFQFYKSPRIVLACLKNAAGDLKKLKQELKLASLDWRDVIVSAEYPVFSTKMHRAGELSDDERAAIYKQDWQQYCDWLRAGGQV